MLYISELCEDCAVANEIDYEIDDAWTNIHGIHDNEPTLTAYWPWDLWEVWFLFEEKIVTGSKWHHSYLFGIYCKIWFLYDTILELEQDHCKICSKCV